MRRNFADVSLEDMTIGTDARRLFTTDEVVPGMFTRQAWEGGIQQAIDKAASSRRGGNRLGAERFAQNDVDRPVAGGAEARLTRRHFTDFTGSWLNFLNSLRLNPADQYRRCYRPAHADKRCPPVAADCPDEYPCARGGRRGNKGRGCRTSLIKSAKDLAVGGKDKPVIDQSAARPAGSLWMTRSAHCSS
ncbi:ImcF-related family protein [Klebsiella pneumoniae subsp. pneumoniae]|nr:ImcF-related family protein [Klebsiella pneumoniae subsp. pneumoniae]